MWRVISEPKFDDGKVEYLDEGKIAIVSMNRPKKYNAITYEMFDHIKEVFDYIGRNGSDVRAIVFTGSGKNFSAGLDLASVMKFKSMTDSETK